MKKEKGDTWNVFDESWREEVFLCFTYVESSKSKIESVIRDLPCDDDENGV